VDVKVADNEHLHRYEALVDGEVAGFIGYRPVPGGVRDLVHTEVDPAFEGKGVGSRLVTGALEAIRASGGRILASCPFVCTYLKRHEEYRDLLS
jgi:predicted GNAT family acetyltransferase